METNNKTNRVSISLNDEQNEIFRAIAKKQNLKKTTLACKVLLDYLDNNKSHLQRDDQQQKDITFSNLNINAPP